jgi:hypothetical protein
MQDDSTPEDHTDAVIQLDGDLADNMSARVDFCTLTGFSKDKIPARCTLSRVYDLVRVPLVVLQLVKASTMDGNRSGLVLTCRCALGCLACAFSWQVASGGKEGRWEKKRLLEDVGGR